MKQLSKISLFLKKQLLIHRIPTRWLVISILVSGLLLQISDADEIASTAKYFMTALVPGKSKSFSSDSVKASFSRIKDSNKKGDCETKRSNFFHLLCAFIFLLFNRNETILFQQGQLNIPSNCLMSDYSIFQHTCFM